MGYFQHFPRISGSGPLIYYYGRGAASPLYLRGRLHFSPLKIPQMLGKAIPAFTNNNLMLTIQHFSPSFNLGGEYLQNIIKSIHYACVS